MSISSDRPGGLLARLRRLLTRAHSSRTRWRLRQQRLGLEVLEDRLTPATLTVTSSADPSALTAGTLRYELNQANSDAAAGVSDTIVFNTSAMDSTTITLTQGQLELKAGSGTTTIDGGGQVAISGNNVSRNFQIDSGATVALDGLTIKSGYVGDANGGGIANNGGNLTLNNDILSGNSAVDVVVNGEGGGGGEGGGVYNSGKLTINNSTLTGNTAMNAYGGGGIYNFTSGVLTISSSTLTHNYASDFGGGIYTYGTVTIADSTLSNNTAADGGGGAIYDQDAVLTLNDSTLSGNAATASVSGGYGGGLFVNGPISSVSVTNCTLSGNSATIGGAVANEDDASLTLKDSTLSANSAATRGGGLDNGGSEFGEAGPLALTDTIVAANTSSLNPDVSGRITTDNGNNLLGTAVNNSTNDPTPGPHDLFSNSPLLGALASNGGPTQTLALLNGSPAIGAGVALTGITTDQRGVSRSNPPDIGAFQTATLSSLTISAPGVVTAGTGFSVAITGQNQDGSSYNGSVTLTCSDGQTVTPAAVTLVNGTATTTVTLDTADSVKLSAAASSVTASSGSITVNPAAADHLSFSVQPVNATAGSTLAPAVQVEVLDQYGNRLTADNSDQVTLSIASGPSGAAFAGNSKTSTTVSGGIATFGNLVLDTAGNYTLSATATGGLTGPDSSSFSISTAGADHLSFIVPPGVNGVTTAGSAINPAVQVELFDAFGNPITGDNTDTVTLAIANAKGPSAFAGGTAKLTATLNGGVATFANVVINSAGSYTLAVNTAGGVTGATSGSFAIAPAAIHSLAVSPSVTQVMVGTGFNVSIRARDAYGNTITAYNGPVTLSSSDGQGVYPGSVMLNKGSANPVVTLYSIDSSVSLTASAGSIRGTSNAIGVIADNGPSTNPVAQYSFTLYITGGSGNAPQAMRPNAAPPDDPTFTVIAQSEADAQLAIANEESLLQQQDSLAAGSTISTVDPATGIDSVLMSPLGQDRYVPDNLTVTRVVPASAPGPAASFALSFQAIDQADSLQQVMVSALDSDGNVATGYGGTVTLASTDPLFGEPITYTFTAADEGSHTFIVNLDTAGIQTLTVMDTGSGSSSGQAMRGDGMAPQDSSSSPPSGQGLIEITPTPAASLVINAAGTNTAGSVDAVTLTALDAFGNVATSYTGTVSFSAQNGRTSIVGLPASYRFTPADHGSHVFAVTFKSTGSQTIIAADTRDLSLISQTQVQVNAAPAKLLITSQPPTTVTAGTGFDLTVEAVDGHGNVVSNFNGLVTLKLAENPAHGSLGVSTLSFQAVNGVANFVGLTLNKAGAGYVLRVSSGALTATTRAIHVTANAPSEFVILSQLPSKIGANSPFGLKVAAEDGFGNVISSYSGTVSLALASGPDGASIQGNLTATLVKGVATFSGLKIMKAGSGYSLTASGSLTAATTSLFSVTPGAATQLVISTQPPNSVNASTPFGLVVTALDTFGNVASSYNGKVTLSLASNPTGATLSGKVTLSAVKGVIAFTDLLLNNPGNGYRLKAASGRLLAETDAFSVLS